MKWAIGAVVVGVLTLGGLLWLLAFPGAPAGYHWPQHTLWGGGPAAVAEGTLGEDGGCFYLEPEPPGQPALIVWPMFSSVSTTTEGPVIHIDGHELHIGERVRFGGGWYDDQLPESGQDALRVPCGGPWLLVTGVAD